MLSGADIRLNTDYFAHKEELSALAHKTVFTGMLDEYFDSATELWNIVPYVLRKNVWNVTIIREMPW